jgi:hypothetical protein
VRAPMPLIVRGGLNRTFGSLAGFAALAFLALGIYLLGDAFAHPVDAEAAGVIVAAFAIALAILLLFFLFKPRANTAMLQSGAAGEIVSRTTKARSTASSAAARLKDLRVDLPYQRAYVDRSRIRPRAPSAVQARGIAGK